MHASNATNKYARKDYIFYNTLMVAVLVRQSFVSVCALTPAPELYTMRFKYAT